MTNLLKVAPLLAVMLFQHHCGARAETPKSISGTVTDFKAGSLQIGVRTDGGETVFFTVGPETQVVQVPPGERDLSKGQPAKVTDLARGDRILVSFVSGLTDARRIVWITATDIAARNAAERADWQKRGISGIVSAVEGDRVTIEMRKPGGADILTLEMNPKTNIRRYAPDSVSFTEALPSNLAAVSKGDQLRARGTRSEDGKTFAAEEVVFGTFLTKVGAITSVDVAERQIQILDEATQKPLTIRVVDSSQIKLLPDMKTMFAAMVSGGGPHSPSPAPNDAAKAFDPGSMIGQLPAGKMDDLKAGSTVIVTSTTGSRPDRVTAILLMANADALVKMARSSSKKGDSMTATEAISTLHGGMMSGPGGLSIPTIIP